MNSSIEFGNKIDKLVQNYFRYKTTAPELESENFSGHPIIYGAQKSGNWCVQLKMKRKFDGTYFWGICDLILENKVYEVKASILSKKELEIYYFPQLVGYAACISVFIGGIFRYHPIDEYWEFIDMSHYFQNLRDIRKCWLELLELIQ